jgi:hypothetical protein
MKTDKVKAMIRVKPNTVAALLVWIAVIALVVSAWSQFRMAQALEDLAERIPRAVVADTGRTR